MRKHRFFIQQPLDINTEILLDDELSHYIARVLRMQATEQIYLFNNSGNEYLATIANLTRNKVTAIVQELSYVNTESPCNIHLGQVLGKNDKMDVVIQKTTELGITSITPLYSKHSVIKNVPNRIDNKMEHWQKIAISASCQAWRNIVPQIYAPISVDEWIINNKATTKIILHPDNTAQHLQTLAKSQDIAVIIGPEGGFSDNEISNAEKHGFVKICLGPRILRTETAGIAVIGILQALFGDL